MKIFGQPASYPKLLIGSKLSLGKQEIKFPSEEPDLVLYVSIIEGILFLL